MIKEILYRETMTGVFEPAPTRAQKRKAKHQQQERASKLDKALGILLFAVVVLGYAAIFAANFVPVSWWAKL
jgi:uncharacterized membrane protein